MDNSRKPGKRQESYQSPRLHRNPTPKAVSTVQRLHAAVRTSIGTKPLPVPNDKSPSVKDIASQWPYVEIEKKDSSHDPFQGGDRDNDDDEEEENNLSDLVGEINKAASQRAISFSSLEDEEHAEDDDDDPFGSIPPSSLKTGNLNVNQKVRIAEDQASAGEDIFDVDFLPRHSPTNASEASNSLTKDDNTGSQVKKLRPIASMHSDGSDSGNGFITSNLKKLKESFSFGRSRHAHDDKILGHDDDDFLSNLYTTEDVVPELTSRRHYSFQRNRASAYMKAQRVAFRGHGLTVLALSVIRVENSNDTWILSGSEDKTLRVWSLYTGNLVATLKGHTQRISGVTSYCDGGKPASALAITCSWDETLRIWPLAQCLKERQISPRHAHKIHEECIKLSGHRNRVFGVATMNLPNGVPVVASASADNTIRVWSLPKGEYLYSLMNDDDFTWNLCIAGINITTPTSVISRKISSRRPSTSSKGDNDVSYRDEEPAQDTSNAASDMNNDLGCITGPIVAVGCKNSTVRIWKLPNVHAAPKHSSKPTGIIRGHPSRIHTLVLYQYHEETFIATACRDFSIRVWRIDGTLVRTLKGHRSHINLLSAFDTSDARGGAIIVSGSKEGNMRVWKHSTGEVLRYFNGHTEEVTALYIFEPPAEVDGLVILSGSKDCTVRAWLYAKETSLRVIKHANARKNSKLNSLSVYCEGDAVVIFTGADDGWLSAWVVDSSGEHDDGFSLAWRVRAHKSKISSVTSYTPHQSHALESIDNDYPDFLDDPLVISGDRAGYVRIANINRGLEIVPQFKAHDDQINALSVFSGQRPATKLHCAIHPFFATCSDDNFVKIWSLVDQSLLYTLEGHVFDVTCVKVFSPHEEPINSTPLTATEHHRHNIQLQAIEQGPLVISGSMDNTVRIWSHFSSTCVKTLTDSSSHVSSISVIDLKSQGPLLAGGDTDGNLYVWSLVPPFILKHVFKAHSDEICTLDMFDVEFHHPVLLSGSWDTTISIWDLSTMEYKRTLEGHTGRVSDLKIFTISGSDAGVASCSPDMTVRVLFDFLGSIPQTDVIRHLFMHDLRGTAVHLQLSSHEAWPRIKEAMKNVGAETFFSIHFELFADALEYNRADFLLEFLPLCRAGLMKCNHLSTSASRNAEVNEDNRCTDRNLLMRAIYLNHREAISIIVDCWCKFFSVLPTSDADPLYELLNDDHFLLDVMEALADYAPREYEKLICSVRLMPVKGNRIPKDALFLERNSHTRHLELKRRQEKEHSHANYYYYYLPIPYYASANTLKMYDKVCSTLGSVTIFDSEAGSLVLTLSWLSYGVDGHSKDMAVYVSFIILASCDIFFFRYMKHELAPLYYILAIVELLLDGYYLIGEVDQFRDEPSRYFLQIWNYLDLLVIFGNVVIVLLHLVYWESTAEYKYIAALFAIAMWFNMLHYLRAFAATGPLVAMILRISSDIKYLLFVLLLVLLGFSQAFWIVAERHGNTPFASVDTGMMALFTYMVGDYTPFDIPGAAETSRQDQFLQALSVVYMLIVSILLLNLLIALMGDSFGTVKSDALAHWALHKAQICIDVGAQTLSASDKQESDSRVLYVRTDTAPVEVNIGADTAIEILERKVDRLTELLLQVTAAHNNGGVHSIGNYEANNVINNSNGPSKQGL